MRQFQRPTHSYSAGVFAAVAATVLLLAPVAKTRADECVGDCDKNGVVGINELVMMVNIALGNATLAQCAVDTDGDGEISIAELVSGTRSALRGCTETGPTPTPSPDPNQTPGTCGETFDSTFKAIQKVVFEKRSCTNVLCHGNINMPAGMLDLSPDVAYDNLVEAHSSEVDLSRVKPGDTAGSYLFSKLAAATDPSQVPPGFQITGAPMPNGLPPLTADELKAVRLWIYAGAPKDGTVPETDTLLNACLPTPAPILIKPLDPPAAGEGIQLTMPEWHLEAHSEHEICFATYYDITDQVPEEYRDPSGTLFRFDANELRQDPQSHHLILNRYVGPAENVHDPSFGAWTCAGGDNDGDSCEPTDPTSCGAGLCRSEIKQSFACIGFGPSASGGRPFFAIGGAQVNARGGESLAALGGAPGDAADVEGLGRADRA
jgi:hypothetical protein